MGSASMCQLNMSPSLETGAFAAIGVISSPSTAVDILVTTARPPLASDITRAILACQHEMTTDEERILESVTGEAKQVESR